MCRNKITRLLALTCVSAILFLVFIRTAIDNDVRISASAVREFSTFSFGSPSNFNIISQNALRPRISNHHARKEVRHIGFLKVHKAASSTMQNMFFRFGMKRNLTFVFSTHPNYFSRNAANHLPLVSPKYRDVSEGYDILCNHGVYNHNVYAKVLRKDAVYIGIVREPLDAFISSVNYYSQKGQLLPHIGRVPGNKVVNLLRRPDRYDKGFFSYTKNFIARDFGFPATLDRNTVSNKLSELSDVFKLVLLVEYFDESLVLMRRYLNWSLEDILYLPNNVGSSSMSPSIKDLSPLDIDMFKTRNSLDYEVYDFFYDKFWKQYKAEYDTNIHLEVLHFKNVLLKLFTFCNNKEGLSGKDLKIEKSVWNEEFHVQPDECALMKKHELDFIVVLREKQGSQLKG